MLICSNKWVLQLPNQLCPTLCHFPFTPGQADKAQQDTRIQRTGLMVARLICMGIGIEVQTKPDHTSHQHGIFVFFKFRLVTWFVEIQTELHHCAVVPPTLQMLLACSWHARFCCDLAHLWWSSRHIPHESAANMLEKEFQVRRSSFQFQNQRPKMSNTQLPHVFSEMIEKDSMKCSCSNRFFSPQNSMPPPGQNLCAAIQNHRPPWWLLRDHCQGSLAVKNHQTSKLRNFNHTLELGVDLDMWRVSPRIHHKIKGYQIYNHHQFQMTFGKKTIETTPSSKIVTGFPQNQSHQRSYNFQQIVIGVGCCQPPTKKSDGFSGKPITILDLWLAGANSPK